MKLLFDYRRVDFFDINENGIQLIDQGDSIEIYNDPFRTVPLFLTMGLLSSEQKKEFDKLPIRSAGIAARYTLISLARIL